jgi:hypothetical protein
VLARASDRSLWLGATGVVATYIAAVALLTAVPG